jgi:hypothetical protein
MFRTGAILAFIIAAAIIAYQIGSRLSDQAIMTIVGVMCGIAASIPVSIGLLIALTRERTTYVSEEYYEPEPEPAPAPYTVYRPPAPQYTQSYQQPQSQTPQQPQIIFVASPQGQPQPGYGPYGSYLQPPQLGAGFPAPMQERNFKIVGEDDGE